MPSPPPLFNKPPVKAQFTGNSSPTLPHPSKGGGTQLQTGGTSQPEQSLTGKDGKHVPTSLIPGRVRPNQKISYPSTPKVLHHLRGGGVRPEIPHTSHTGSAQSSNSATGSTNKSPLVKSCNAVVRKSNWTTKTIRIERTKALRRKSDELIFRKP